MIKKYRYKKNIYITDEALPTISQLDQANLANFLSINVTLP
jgi:hypothetical protein